MMRAAVVIILPPRERGARGLSSPPLPSHHIRTSVSGVGSRSRATSGPSWERSSKIDVGLLARVYSIQRREEEGKHNIDNFDGLPQ